MRALSHSTLALATVAATCAVLCARLPLASADDSENADICAHTGGWAPDRPMATPGQTCNQAVNALVAEYSANGADVLTMMCDDMMARPAIAYNLALLNGAGCCGDGGTRCTPVSVTDLAKVCMSPFDWSVESTIDSNSGPEECGRMVAAFAFRYHGTGLDPLTGQCSTLLGDPGIRSKFAQLAGSPCCGSSGPRCIVGAGGGSDGTDL